MEFARKDQRAAQAAWAKAEQTLGSARQALIEALVGMIRTGGTGSFNMISDKDRIFFAGLMLSASPVATAEELAAEAEKVRAMRKRLQAPKCNDCEGAPDLTGDFHMESWAEDEREVRALKYMILSTLQELSGAVHRALEKEVTDASVNETFYRTLFTLGEDFAEEDLLQIAYGLDDLRAQVAVYGSEADVDSRN